MASIVYQKNKKSGHVYAYHAVAYRDPVTKKPTSRRTFIGRVDPSTKAFVDPVTASQRLSELEPLSNPQQIVSDQTSTENNNQLADEVQVLKRELSELKARMAEKDAIVLTIRDALNTYIIK